MQEQTACVVGETLFKRMKWKLGQTVPVRRHIYPGSWEFTIRAVYRAKNKSFGEENLFFHWKYLDEKGMGGRRGGHLRARARPTRRAPAHHAAVDAHVRELSAAHAHRDRAGVPGGFVSMYGNVPFVLRVIGSRWCSRSCWSPRTPW
jgi:hypothetical protein